jgi:hypothetical protein
MHPGLLKGTRTTDKEGLATSRNHLKNKFEL